MPVGTRPESVTRGFGGDLYVTLQQGKVAGDGVLAIIKAGQVYSFATGFDEPKGITFTGKRLLLTDVTKVWAVDEKGVKTVIADEKDFPMPIRFLNDIALSYDNRYAYVSDMGASDKMFGPDGRLWPLGSVAAKELPAIGRVYRIRLSDNQVTLAVGESPDMPTPNGVCVRPDGTLLIADFFTGNILENRRGKPVVIRTGFRGADGIDLDRHGNIYLTSWTDGKLWRISPDPLAKDNPKVLIEGLKSAADLYVDSDGSQVLFPDMASGTLVSLPLK